MRDATESKGPEYMGEGGHGGRERIRPEGIFWGDEVFWILIAVVVAQP